ncbi:unnamed protein product [Cuscuta campestris]|uniref:Uncharacterized protein n=1 Tax=Cuscuta campestris TaxID=132261 RepID=A0A484K6E7_9ASTE|nr:unnamed protein product [Cuscuta campestris]
MRFSCGASFQRVKPQPATAKLLANTKKLSQGAVEIRTVVTEESLAKLGFKFVKDERHHQPTLLRDILGRNADSGPFVELKEDTEGDMDQYQLPCCLTLGDQKKKRKRDAASHDELHRPSLSHEASLGVWELTRRATVHQSSLDEVRKPSVTEKKKQQDKVDRLAKELVKGGHLNSNLQCRVR